MHFHSIAAVLIVLSCSAAQASVVRGDSVTLGTINMTGGTAVVANPVDMNAIDQNSNCISGTLCNKTGTALNDITFTIKRPSGTTGAPPSFGSVTTPGNTQSGQTPSNGTIRGDGDTCTVTFATPIPIDGCIMFAVNNVNHGANDVACSFSPSHGSQGISGAKAAVFPRYTFTSSIDLLSQAGECSHDRIVFQLKNDEPYLDIVGWTGTIVFVDNPSATITSVLHQDVQSNHAGVPGSTTSVGACTFTVTGFAPLGDEGLYELVIVFDQELRGGLVRVRIEPTYDVP